MLADRALPERWLKIGEEVKRVCFTFRSFCLFEQLTGISLIRGEPCDFANEEHLLALLQSSLDDHWRPAVLKEGVALSSMVTRKFIQEALVLSSPPSVITEQIKELEGEIEEIEGKPDADKKPEPFNWLLFMASVCFKFEISEEQFWHLTPAKLEAMFLLDLKVRKNRLQERSRGVGHREMTWESLVSKMPKPVREKVLKTKN